MTKSKRALFYHIRDAHKISSKEYYDKHERKDGEGMCTCGKPTPYLSLTRGYAPTCGHKCGAKLFRKRLKADPVKHKNFVTAVTENMKSEWQQRDTVEKVRIFAKVSSTKAINNASLTSEDRQKRYSRYYNCSPEKIKDLNEKGRQKCLLNHKLGLSGYSHGMKGKFKVTNPEKYLGNPRNVIYRSSFEFNYMMKLDHDPAVISWQSEELKIPYTSPIDRRFHLYYPDFVVTKKTATGIQTFVIEIKPSSQCKAPVKAKKASRRYISEAKTFATNQAKWESAQRYCNQRGYRFVVLTEKDLKLG